MTPRTRWALVLGVALVGACGLLNPKRGKPKRVATPKPQRVGPEKKGLDLAAVPTPAPTTMQVLGGGLLVGVSDGLGTAIDDDAAHEGEVAWLAATLERGGDDETARTLVKIRRAAFGVHVPRAGERRAVEDDVLEDRGLGIDASAVALFGPEGPCLARRGKPIVTALETGSHRLDIRWPLEGCGAGPWAPLGIVAHQIPTTLRWTPPVCEESDDDRAAWSVIDDDGIARLGVIRDGATVVGLIGQAADGNWLWIANDWRARGFTLAGKPAIGCATPPVAADVGESSGP